MQSTVHSRVRVPTFFRRAEKRSEIIIRSRVLRTIVFRSGHAARLVPDIKSERKTFPCLVQWWWQRSCGNHHAHLDLGKSQIPAGARYYVRNYHRQHELEGYRRRGPQYTDAKRPSLRLEVAARQYVWYTRARGGRALKGSTDHTPWARLAALR